MAKWLSLTPDPPRIPVFYTLRRGSDATPLVPNLTEVLSTAKERRLNQFGTAVLIWCGKNVKFDRVCRIIRHWSGRWFIRRSSHVPNQINTLWLSSHKSLGELVTHARKFFEEGKMAAKDGQSCKQCKRWTKYRCIRCKVAICNLCSKQVMDESVDGWIGGKNVRHCFECETVRPVTESLIASRHS